ncbi:MAG: hypothetical protein WD512_13730 [Candidatus Paceibacterota bacterium]
MRTSIFKNFTQLDVNKFRDDLGILYSLEENEQSILIDGLLQIVRKNTSGEADEVIEKTLEKIDRNKGELLKAFQVLQYLYSQWSPVNDTSELFISDLKELELLPQNEEEEEKSLKFFLKLFSVIEEDNKFRMKSLYRASGLPNFNHISTIVELRPYFDAPFGSINNKSIEDYNPVCLGWFPKTIINLSVDRGPIESINFQADKRQIQYMIDILKSSLKDLDAAMNSVNLLEAEDEENE